MPKKTNHEKQGGKIISTLNFPLFFILFSRQWPGPAPPIFFYQPHLPFSFPSGKMKKKKDVGWKRYGGAEAEPVFHINFAFDPSATPGEGEINMKKNRLAWPDHESWFVFGPPFYFLLLLLARNQIVIENKPKARAAQRLMIFMAGRPKDFLRLVFSCHLLSLSFCHSFYLRWQKRWK